MLSFPVFYESTFNFNRIMHLEILTPEKKVFEGEVTVVTFPGADGSFQVLDNHAPLISLLKEGLG